MPPYPFGPWPKWEEFLSKLREYDVELKEAPFEKVELPPELRGRETVKYLERTVEERALRVPVDVKNLEHVAPDVIRSICTRLDIKVRDLFEQFNLG